MYKQYFTLEDAQTLYPEEIGYDKDVPMSGDLSDSPKGNSATFLVAALKDSYSGTLDHIQIIKYWFDSMGKTHEKVYDMVWAAYEAKCFGIKMPEKVQMVTQERAYTSPIWCTP